MMNTKWLWVVAIALLGTVLYIAFDRSGGSGEIFRGEVITVDAETFRVTVKGVSEPSVKTVVISPETVIEKTVFENTLAEQDERSFSTREVNVQDVQAGERVVVTYGNERDNTLTEVRKVAVAAQGSVSAFLEAVTPSSPFLKTVIAEVDTKTRTITFNPYEQGVASAKTALIPIPEGTVIQSVRSEDRLPFEHAYSVSSFADITPGKTLFVSASSGIGPNGEFVPDTFILLETR